VRAKSLAPKVSVPYASLFCGAIEDGNNFVPPRVLPTKNKFRQWDSRERMSKEPQRSPDRLDWDHLAADALELARSRRGTQ
jgi:hypothetical protein